MAWAPDYATPVELAAYVRIDDTADDAQLTLAIAAASRAVDRHTVRQFGAVEVAQPRRYTARWSPTRCGWLVPVDDLMTMTDLAVEVDGTALADGWTLRPYNAPAKGVPWTELLIDSTAVTSTVAEGGGVEVTAVWGWSAVPDTVKQATLLQASRLLGRRDAPFGVAGSPETGSEVRLLARVDPDVQVTLSQYRRRVGAG